MKKLNKEVEDQLVGKINELYINFRQYFAILTPQGRYLSSQAIKGDPKLNDNWVRNHLREKHSLVVFSGKEVSKFLCFDVDVKDKQIAKWVTYKIMHRLIELGFDDKDIHTSTSGNKGFHVLLFIEDGTSISNLKFIYNTVLEEEDLKHFEHGQVEYRNTHTQGVKIELSRNFKNNKSENSCWFVRNQSLRQIKNKEYLLQISPIPKQKFTHIINQIKDTYSKDELDIKQEMEIIQQLNEPVSHKLHKDEYATIDRTKELLINGLTISGSRHNSVLLLAKYFRYMGMELDHCIEELSKWMECQDSRHYSSTLEYALNEVERISTLVYNKEYSLVTAMENIKIYKSEMERISTIRNKNLRLIMYSMLIHSKRYAMQNGVFYMTYEQIGEMVGLTCSKNVLSNVNKLEKEGCIEIVERNIKQSNTTKKKPNRYRIFDDIDTNGEFYELSYDDTISRIETSHNDLILQFVALDTLKVNLPKKQYLELRKLAM